MEHGEVPLQHIKQEPLNKKVERLVHANPYKKQVSEEKRQSIAGKFANKSLPELHELVCKLYLNKD